MKAAAAVTVAALAISACDLSAGDFGTASIERPAGAYAEARSHLHTDSVYPRHGTPVVDTLHYGLALTWSPDAEVLTGDEAVVLRGARHCDAFALDLSDALRVTSLSVDGRPAAYAQRGDKLVVQSPVRRGRLHTLRLRYQGHPTTTPAPTRRSDIPALGFTTTATHEAWTMQEPYGAFTWYAVNDQPADKAYYDFALTVPATWRGIANGRLVGDTVHGTTRTMRWHLGVPAASYLTTVAFGRYRLTPRGRVHGVALTTWTPQAMSPRVPSLRHMATELRWLESKLGRYPYRTLGILVVPSDSGMETQTMITMGDNHYSLEPVNIVHEMAHQWYGDEVTPNDWRDVWMSEGMALFLQCLWQDHARGLRPGTSLRKWTRLDDDFRAQDGPPGHYDRGDFGAANVYAPPARMWQVLEHRLGDPLFWRLVRAWPRSHAAGSTSREALATWWSRQSGRDLHGFFRRWLMSRSDPQ